MIFELNLEIQFLLKQGQVEVDMGEFVPDFSDSVLIHRSRIEDLNSQIKVDYDSFMPNLLPHTFCLTSRRLEKPR